MKNYIYILFVMIGLLGFSSCEKVADDNLEEIAESASNYANLIISMNTPGLSVSTRALDNDPENSGDSWTNWEKFVDGALLYRVTLFVINENGALVGYRDIYSGSADVDTNNGFYENSAVNVGAETGVAVKATFLSDNPVHGDIEKFAPGNYKLVAVANYAEISSDNNSYAGLGSMSEDGTDNYNGDGDFSEIVSGIIAQFSETDGLANFTQNDGFFSYQLNSGEDRVCKLLPQPLVMIRNVALVAGTNQISGLLSRTFARVRLDVKNTDASEVIGVSKLEFNGAYASQKAYLFNDVAAEGANMFSHFALYEDTKGTLTVSSEDAIVSAPTQIERLPVGVTYNIFDCYILEGQISADYAFSFDASYWTGSSGGGATGNYQIREWGPTGTSGNGSGILDFLVFIRIDTKNSTTLLKAEVNTSGAGAVVGGTLTTSNAGNAATDNSSTPLDPSYIWEIIPSSTSISSQRGVATGYLQSIGSSLYLQAYQGGEDMTAQLGYNQSPLIFKINFGDTDEKGSIYCEYGGNYYYISSEGKWTEVTYSREYPNSTDSDNYYQRLTFETITGSKGTREDVEVQQTIMMHEFEGSIPTNEIRRNDFFWGTIPVKVN